MAKSSKRANRKSAAAGSATIHDQTLNRGEGGELHQFAQGDAPMVTTAQGGPVSDDQNSLKIGPRGPTLIEDFHFREKIFHFDHERIPERVVHARGYGAMVSSKTTSRSQNIPARTFFSAPANEPRPS